MNLIDLTRTSALLGETRSRRKKSGLLAECLRQMPEHEIEVGVGYLIGELPQGRIGVGAALFRKAIGKPSSESRLTLSQVDARLADIQRVAGKGSQTSRLQMLRGLMAEATAEEQDFLARLLLGELRQGALEGVMVEAIAQAADLEADEVRRAVMLSGDLAGVARQALTRGNAGLAAYSLELFRPLRPMLAQPADDFDEVFTRIDRAALEYKIDGARVQVHKDGHDVRVFTRHLNEVTDSVPEIVEVVRSLPVARLVLDGEAVALDRQQRPLPFQVTMRRFGRRLDVAAQRAAIPLSVSFFDCLHLDGADLIDQPGDERVTALQQTLPQELCVPRQITARADEAHAFLQRALAEGHEGIMAKSLHAAYQAGNRGADWLKIKPAHTLDLVVLAAEWGSGRRKGWLSNLHLGARDPVTGEYVMLGKTFKGLTDATLAWQTEQLLTREIGRDGNVVHVRPELVVEIVFNEVQTSHQYPAGLALRFARVKRYRDDKTAAESDTLNTVLRIHQSGLQGLQV